MPGKHAAARLRLGDDALRWRGAARRGVAGRGRAGRGKAWQGKSRQGSQKGSGGNIGAFLLCGARAGTSSCPLSRRSTDHAPTMPPKTRCRSSHQGPAPSSKTRPRATSCHPRGNGPSRAEKFEGRKVREGGRGLRETVQYVFDPGAPPWPHLAHTFAPSAAECACVGVPPRGCVDGELLGGRVDVGHVRDLLRHELMAIASKATFCREGLCHRP